MSEPPIDPPARLGRGRISTIGPGDASAGASAPPYLSPLVNGQFAEDKLQMRLNGGPEAAGAARGALQRLDRELEPPVVEALRLLVTELIANSVKHADALTVGLKILVGSSSVLVEVTDEGPGFTPRKRMAGQDKTSGWGLFLVERLADRWGVGQEGDTTRVWFELRR
jgi:anti-sigma regulatory factor (Ser/Thr protein kinase)